jgi:hypothetical protein
MKRTIFPAILATLWVVGSAYGMTPEERKAYLDKMVELLPQVQSWTEWQQKTGALPPDFDALPKINTLPDPFLFLDGKRVVKTPEDWQARRAEIRELFEKYDIGRIPPKPKLDQIIPVSAEQAAAEAAARGGGRGFGRRGGARGPATAPWRRADAPAAVAGAAAGRRQAQSPRSSTSNTDPTVPSPPASRSPSPRATGRSRCSWAAAPTSPAADTSPAASP